jgi:hypothetical protein
VRLPILVCLVKDRFLVFPCVELSLVGEKIYILVINKKGKQPPSEPMVSKYSKLTILQHTVQMSFIDR